MRYKPGQKEETRKKILDAAGQSFRSHGYSGIGVDGLAKHAGVTSGAFYSHFGSKQDAFNAALDAGLDEVIVAIPKFQKKHGAAWVKEFVSYYLSKAHRKDLACGCAMASLTSEVVRAETKLHGVYESKMSEISGLIAEGLSGADEENRRVRAWSLLGILIGGLNMLRALKTTTVVDELAESIEVSAVKIAGKARSATK